MLLINDARESQERQLAALDLHQLGIAPEPAREANLNAGHGAGSSTISCSAASQDISGCCSSRSRTRSSRSLGAASVCHRLARLFASSTASVISACALVARQA